MNNERVALIMYDKAQNTSFLAKFKNSEEKNNVYYFCKHKQNPDSNKRKNNYDDIINFSSCYIRIYNDSTTFGNHLGNFNRDRYNFYTLVDRNNNKNSSGKK